MCACKHGAHLCEGGNALKLQEERAREREREREGGREGGSARERSGRLELLSLPSLVGFGEQGPNSQEYGERPLACRSDRQRKRKEG